MKLWQLKIKKWTKNKLKILSEKKIIELLRKKNCLRVEKKNETATSVE